MTSASHAEGRQFDPGQVYDSSQTSSCPHRLSGSWDAVEAAAFVDLAMKLTRKSFAENTQKRHFRNAKIVACTKPLVSSIPKRTFCHSFSVYDKAHSDSVRHKQSNKDMSLAGLEPAIFGSEDQRLIH